MSRYRSNYNSNESRRSPRQQSPGRYDISDDFRGGTRRERRRSNPDSRTIKPPFISNRELFHDSMSRESTRNFSREPPRGPKGVPDAPTGPRASSYGDFRNDFGLQSDVRSERGRGRGRSWRDDSRDKGREIERDYRDRRDDRFISSIRDDRGRDRWASHDVYNTGRRPPSPYGRARSPIISQRDPLEPQNLELERIRRGSRDAPLTNGLSLLEKPQHLVRGFGKSRGARGRARTGYYDEYHRIAGPSRSPTETGWNPRTQPSATPPPPVPAFGSASNSITAGSNSPTGTIAITHGLIPGVTVPTAPRSERRSTKAIAHPSTQIFNENSNRELIDKQSEISISTTNMAPRISSPIQILDQNNIKYDIDKRKGEIFSEPKNKSPRKSEKEIAPSPQAYRHSAAAAAKVKSPILKRRPIIGKRSGRSSGILIDDEGNTSDSDSGDDFGDDYFEKEIEKVKAEIDAISVNNPLLPRAEPKGIFLNVFIQSDILDVIEGTEFASLANCKSFENEVETQSRISTLSPTTPNLSDRGQAKDPKNLLPVPVDSKFPLSQEAASDGLSDIQKRMTGSLSAKFSLKTSNFLPKGRSTSMDLVGTDVESNSGDNILLLDAVRKRMRTPPISSLPRLNRELWFRDLEFLKSLEPNPIVESNLVRHLAEIGVRRKRDQEKERRRWASRYHRYRRFTDRSSDPAAIRSRERFLKSRAKSAAAALSPPSVFASTGSKPKGSRRIGSRFATEHELQRVLLQSEQEAKESKEQKEQKERATRTSTTIAKEAIVPNMLWDKEERDAIHFEDRSGLISFERSFARLEFGEPIDNFTKEETISFEKLYFESPKQWGKIAKSIPNRDYKSCIQHYYLVKHPSNLKKKLKDHSRKRKGRQSKVKKEKEKTIASINDQGSTRDDEEVPDGQADGRSRRPRRAAAPTFNSESKDQASENDITSPIVISTTNIAVPPNNEHNPDTPIDSFSHTPSFSPPTPPPAPATPLLPPPTTSVKRKAKAPREKATKQAKNNQTPASVSVGRRVDSPPTSLTLDLKARREIEKNAQIGTGSGNASPQHNLITPFIVPTEQAPSSVITSTKNSDKASQQTQMPEIEGTVLPSKADLPQAQKNLQQTSSYWSVPEQDVFSALLGHFGTNWHEIAKYMTTKTHIMVKNHYQRQVDSGKMKEWEVIAKAADEKIEKAEPTGPLPLPIVIPTKRYPDIPAPSTLRSGSKAEICDDMTIIPLVSPSNGSNLQSIGLSSQDPSIICQTSPSPTIKPSIASSKSNKGIQAETILQAQPLNAQAPRVRGPPLGYFDTGPPLRLQQKSEKVSQRTLKAALDAQVERELALRMEKEQREIQMQKQPQRLQQRQQSQTQSQQLQQPVSMQPQTQPQEQTRPKQHQIQNPNQPQSRQSQQSVSMQSQAKPQEQTRSKQHQNQIQNQNQPQSRQSQQSVSMQSQGKPQEQTRSKQHQNQIQNQNQPQSRQSQQSVSMQSQAKPQEQTRSKQHQNQIQNQNQPQSRQSQELVSMQSQAQPQEKTKAKQHQNLNKSQNQPQSRQSQQAVSMQSQAQPQEKTKAKQSQNPNQPQSRQSQQPASMQSQAQPQEKVKAKQHQNQNQNQQQSHQPKLNLSQQRHQQSQSQTQLQLQHNLPVQPQPQAQTQRYHNQSQVQQQKLQLPQQTHQLQHHQLSQPLSHQQQQNQQVRSQSQPQTQSNPQQHQKLHQKQQSVLRPDYASDHEHPYQLKAIQREAKQSIVHHEQQNIMQKEKHAQNEHQLFSMKQENISPKIEQREAFVSSRMHSLSGQSAGNEASNMTPNSAELRHSLQAQQIHNLHSRLNHTLPQSLLNENPGVEREVKSSPTQNIPGGIVTPCKTQELYIASQPIVSTNARQPEVVRKMSNIMSLLNNDEPSEARPSPHRQISENHSATHSSQLISSYSLPSVSRYPSKESQATSQHPASITHKPSQASSQPDLQHKNIYSQQNSRQAPPNSSSIGKHPRSYTLAPSKFENHGYPPSMQSQQQKMYQQSSQCQPINSQNTASIHRDISRNEIHVITGSYSGRPVTSNQSSGSRLKESPYSVTSPSSLTCQSRSATSPIDLGNTDQDYYGNQHQLQRVPSSLHENSLPQNIQQQSFAGSNNSSSTTHFNRTALQNQHSYQNPQHSQSSHSLGQPQPQSQKQPRLPKSRSVEQIQIPFGHSGHISGTGSGTTSQLVQYPAQILPNSHSQLSLQKDHSSPGKLSTNRRSKREIFDGRYNNQLPPSTTAQNSSQQDLSYVMPLHSSVSGTYSVQSYPSSHGTSLGPHHTAQHGDMNGNYIQYERHVRDDEYHHSRVRGHEDRDRERIR